MYKWHSGYMLTYEKCYGKTANTKKMTNFVISEQ